MNLPPPVVIIGAGLAGLSCAIALYDKGIPFVLVESTDRVGGRVSTDKLQGFTLDRGFQVLLTAYPECRKMLDYEKLKLSNFTPGALVFQGGHLHTVADPFRVPLAAIPTLLSPIGSLADKMKVWVLKEDLIDKPLADIFSRAETQTREELKKLGFSDEFVKRFFTPFFGGIFLESDLTTSSKMFEFIFSMFSQGHAALPADGMQAIPEQLVAKIPADSVLLNSRVINIGDDFVELDSGRVLKTRAIVVATDGPEANKLLQGVPPVDSHAVTCMYYEAAEAPIKEPMLVLNGEGKGKVNNVCVPSNVAPSYGNGKTHLVSVSVLGNPFSDDQAADTEVKTELQQWFGPQAATWRLLRIYRIVNALPDQKPPKLEKAQRDVQLQKGLFVCGDHRDNGSLNGALVSGKRAAEAVIAELSSN
jgi:protoporphyrinogen oxidase